MDWNGAQLEGRPETTYFHGLLPWGLLQPWLCVASGNKINSFRQVVAVGPNSSLENTKEGRVWLKQNRKEIQVQEHVLMPILLARIINASF